MNKKGWYHLNKVEKVLRWIRVVPIDIVKLVVTVGRQYLFIELYRLTKKEFCLKFLWHTEDPIEICPPKFVLADMKAGISVNLGRIHLVRQ